MNRRRLLAAALPLAALSASGCIGSFALTKRVFNWNRGFGSPIVSEIVFLVFIFLPVYEATLFLDAVILNTIEFITGSNPVGAIDAEQDLEVAQGTRIRLRRRDGGLQLTLTEPDGTRTVRELELDAEGARVFDEAGLLIASAFASAEGGILVVDGPGRLLAAYTAEEVARAAQAYDAAGEPALVEAAMEIDAAR